VAKKARKKAKKQQVVVDVQELHKLVEKTRDEFLSDTERQTLNTSIDTLAKRMAPKRSSESKNRLIEQALQAGSQGEGDGDPDTTSPKKKRRGHGRNGADKYKGALKVWVVHPTMQAKGVCTECNKGRCHPIEPNVAVRVEGVAPLNATVYEMERFRCSLCGEIYAAPAPDGIGDKKYDCSVASMIAMLKYGAGTPWYRIEKLQAALAIPVPSGTQCDLVKEAAELLKPVYHELIRQGSQCTVFNSDDTGANILDAVERPAEQDEDRTGLHTTGMVSKVGEHLIALFVTGPQHAGENMTDLLALRNRALADPILMSDGLAANKPKLPPGLEVVMANCLTHARRKFVDVWDSFPQECEYVILELAEVYKNDETAKKQGLDAKQRLLFHQTHSQPAMERIKTWMAKEIDENLTEANSGLGKAINYMSRRWDKLTLFLRQEGAPLDNNIAEQALKFAVLHRKNAMFFKTQNGAAMADLFMSIIHTCRLNRVNPFEYMNAVQRHAVEAAKAPADWLPWNYHLQIRPPPAVVAPDPQEPS
jgi:transposase